MKKQIALFDIDGTLANIEHRQQVLEQAPHNWQEFFERMGDDVLNSDIAELYEIVRNSGKYSCHA